MYKKILHNTENLTALERDLCYFRAKITAKKLHSLGISDNSLYSIIDSLNTILKESKSL